jgi:peptidoglycan/LPS O-acetylase OafA/YrhL
MTQIDPRRIDPDQIDPRIDPDQIDSDQVSSAQVVSVQIDPAHIGSAPIDGELVVGALIDADRVGAERVEGQAVDADQIDAQSVDAELVDGDLVDAELVDGDSTRAEPVGPPPVAAEPTTSEPVVIERVDAEPVDGEPVAVEPVDAKQVDAGPVHTEMVDAEPVDAERADAELIDDEPTDAEPADPEPATSEPIAVEPVDPEPTDAEPVDAQTVDAKPFDADPVAAEPADAEPVVAEPDDAEPVDAEPFDAERDVAEPVDAEPAPTELIDGEATEAEPVDPEPVDPEPATSEAVAAEPVAPEATEAEPVDAEPVDAEPVVSTASSTAPIKSEPIKTEPISSKPISSKPIKSGPTKTEPAAPEPANTEPDQSEPANGVLSNSKLIKNEPIDPARIDPATPVRIVVTDDDAKTTVENELSGQPRHDLPVLEAFRGLAAVMVVFTHVGFISGVGVAGAWAGWLSRLDFGVTLFFLLSGFLLFRPFVQAAYGRRPPVSVRSYLRRRYVRIYPALITVLLFDYLITPEAREADLSLWIYTVLMVQNYFVNFVNQLPGLVQGWSLSIEVSFYVMLPLLARLILGRGTGAASASARARQAREARAARTPTQIRQAALERSRLPLIPRLLSTRAWPAELPAMRPAFLLAAMALISLGWRLGYLLDSGGLNNELLWLPSFLDWFAAGMALAWLRERDTPIPRLLRDISSSTGACWSLALALYWLTTTEVAGPFGLETPSIGATMLKHVVFLLVATLLLLPAVFGNPAASWRRTACNPFFTWLGRISFGVFLWHPMLMGAIRRMLRLEDMAGGFWITLVLTLVASAIAGTLSWRFVEEPLQRRWRNGFRRSQRGPAPNRRQVIIRRKAVSTDRPGTRPEPVRQT